MMKKMSMVAGIALGCLLSAQVLACGIKGTAVNADGSKINGTATVSTWNSKKPFQETVNIAWIWVHAYVVKEPPCSWMAGKSGALRWTAGPP